MTGKEGGVQAILRKKYTRALFFHCSSHNINLVVNDANNVSAIRNTIVTVKDIHFLGNPSLICNLSRLCEIRWSEKYSIRIFIENFTEIVKALETLSVEGNYATRKSAYQLHSAISQSSLIIALLIVSKLLDFGQLLMHCRQKLWF
nr:unnamed protein product [Callosobruchus analis]